MRKLLRCPSHSLTLHTRRSPVFPSNAPSATRATDGPTISAPIQASAAQPAKPETENIQAWLLRSHAELARKGPPTRALSTAVAQTGKEKEAGEAGAMDQALSRAGF